jgi:hypothetical protein
MPFMRIIPATHRNDSNDYVALSAFLEKRGKELTVTLAFYIGPDVFAATGFDPKQKVSVLEGIDSDANTLLIEGNGEGYKFYSGKATRSYSLRVVADRLKNYIVDEPPHRYTTVSYTVDKQTGILLQTPPWLRYRHASIVLNPFKQGVRKA